MIHPNHIGYRRENESKVPAEEAPEESRISRNMGIKPTCSLVSLRAVLPRLCNTTVLIHQSSCSSSFQIQPRNIRITIGDLAFRTGSLQLCVTTARRVFFAVAAFPDSSPFERFFAEKLSKWLFWAKFFTKSNDGTLLVTQPYSSFAEGRVVEGTLPLFKKRKLSKILFSTAIDTTQPELK